MGTYDQGGEWIERVAEWNGVILELLRAKRYALGVETGLLLRQLEESVARVEAGSPAQVVE